MQPVGLLGSTGITPLPRYYGPRRLPVMPRNAYAFARALGSTHMPGLPGSSISLLMRAVPIHPGGPGGCIRSFFTTGNGLHHLRKVGHPTIGVTRPNRVHLRYGSHLRLGRLRRPDYSKAGISSGQTPLRRLHVVRAIHMADSFHSARLTRLGLAHRRPRSWECSKAAIPFAFFAASR